MAHEHVLRLEAPEGIPRWEQAQERMDAEALAGRAEVAGAAEGVCADDDALLRKPERDLPPALEADDGSDDEGRSRQIGQRRDMERHTEPVRDRGAVALVPVEELDDAGRLAEGAEPVVEAVAVDRVGQPHTAVCQHGVRGAAQKLPLGQPAEAVLELVAESERHGDTIPGVEGFSNAEIADRRETFSSLLDLAGTSYYTARAYRTAAELIRETKAPIAELVKAGRARELSALCSRP